MARVTYTQVADSGEDVPMSRMRRSAPANLSREEAASRIQAFVYGNILVIAALVALHPADLDDRTAVAYVLGTTFSTYLAHLVAGLVGHGVRHGQRPTGADLRHELRDGWPIASSGSLALLVLLTARFGWVDPGVALKAAVLVTVARLALLGWVVARIRRAPSSWWTFVSGIVLALVCLVAALLKWMLTH